MLLCVVSALQRQLNLFVLVLELCLQLCDLTLTGNQSKLKLLLLDG